jgi:hypothetical protein
MKRYMLVCESVGGSPLEAKKNALPYLALTFQVGMELLVIDPPSSGKLPLKDSGVVDKEDGAPSLRHFLYFPHSLPK